MLCVGSPECAVQCPGSVSSGAHLEVHCGMASPSGAMDRVTGSKEVDNREDRTAEADTEIVAEWESDGVQRDQRTTIC